MTQREHRAWQSLNRVIPGHVQRVENTVDRGTPDINWQYGDLHIWIELKATEEGGETKIRPEQRVWAIRRVRAGGNVLVIDRRVDRWIAYSYKKELEFIEKSGKMVPVTQPHWEARSPQLLLDQILKELL